jgi:Na+-exporting ATPase
MTVVYHDLEHNTNKAFMKGAPERVLEACSFNAKGGPLTSTEIDHVLDLMDNLASEGLRVLALASRTLKSDCLSRDAVETEMTLLGLVGIYDPPRAESLASVQECQRAGIVVHMLTGDHISTATAIAKEVGIITPTTL